MAVSGPESTFLKAIRLAVDNGITADEASRVLERAKETGIELPADLRQSIEEALPENRRAELLHDPIASQIAQSASSEPIESPKPEPPADTVKADPMARHHLRAKQTRDDLVQTIKDDARAVRRFARSARGTLETAFDETIDKAQQLLRDPSLENLGVADLSLDKLMDGLVEWGEKIKRDHTVIRPVSKALKQTNAALSAGETLLGRLMADRAALVAQGGSTRELDQRVESLQQQLDQLSMQGQMLKAIRGQRGLDEFGMALTGGGGWHLSKVWAAANVGGDTNLLFVMTPTDEKTGRRDKTLHWMTRGAVPMVWARGTRGIIAASKSNGADNDKSAVNFGFDYAGAWAGSDKVLGDYAGYWRPGTGGIMLTSGEDTARIGLQAAIPLGPSGAYSSLDALIEHPALARSGVLKLPIALLKTYVAAWEYARAEVVRGGAWAAHAINDFVGKVTPEGTKNAIGHAMEHARAAGRRLRDGFLAPAVRKISETASAVADEVKDAVTPSDKTLEARLTRHSGEAEVALDRAAGHVSAPAPEPAKST